jgi:hypothetical protein
MANVGFASTQMLPRFLLPQLSWRAVPANGQAVRALTTLSTAYTYPLKPSETRSSRPLVRARSCGALSKLSMLQNPILHRAFHATTRQAKEHHFDTLKFVQRLQDEGFSEKQAVAMMRVLSDVIEERSIPLPPLSHKYPANLSQASET